MSLPTLGDLVQPLSLDCFLRDHWPDRAFYSPGSPARLAPLLEIPELASAETMIRAATRLRGWTTTDDGRFQSVDLTAEAAELVHRVGQATVVLTYLRSKALEDFAACLAESLRSAINRVRVNAYLSKAGPPTTALHWDDHEVFFLQLRGKKRWTFAANEQVAYPLAGHVCNGRGFPSPRNMTLVDRVDERMPATAQTVTLGPGDVLFLPRGWWHQPETFEDSAHLTIAIEARTRAEVWLARMKEHLEASARWRRPFACSSADEQELAEALAGVRDDAVLWNVAQLLRAVGPQGAGEAFATEQILTPIIPLSVDGHDPARPCLTWVPKEGPPPFVAVSDLAFARWLAAQRAPFSVGEAQARSTQPPTRLWRLFTVLIEEGVLSSPG